MSTEENKAIVRGYFEQVQQANWDGLSRFIAADFINHESKGIQLGLDTHKSALRSIRGTFPDQQVVIDDMIAEGDKVVVRTRLRGTHQGSALPTFRGIRPEGRPVEWRFIHIFRLRDGKIVEHWAEHDGLAVRQQLSGAERALRA